MTWKTIATPPGNASIESMGVTGDFVEYGAIAYGTDDAMIFLSDDMGQTFASIDAESLMGYKIDTIAFAPDYKTSRQLFTSSQDGIFRFGPPVDAAAQAAAQADAAAVDATRVARSTTVAGLEFVPEQSDRVETGCLAYTPALAGLFMVFAFAKKGHHRD
jgi:hypothetical protein